MNPRAFYLILIFLISSINLAAGALVGFLGRGQRGTRPFVLFQLALCEWTLAFGVQLMIPFDSPWKIPVLNLQYIGASVGPVLFLFYVLSYTGLSERFGRLKQLLLIEPVVFNLFVWTDPLHHLYRRSVGFDHAAGFHVFATEFGPILWVHVIYAYAVMLAATLLLIRYALQHRPRSQVILLFVAAVAPWLASLLELLGLEPMPIGISHLGFLVTGFSLLINTVRYKLFLIRPADVARTILDNMSDMVLTIGASGRIESANPAVFRTLGFKKHEIHTSHISWILERPRWDDLVREARRGGEAAKTRGGVEASLVRSEGGRVHVLLTVAVLGSDSSALQGYLLVARDTTALEELERERRRSDRLEAVQHMTGGMAHDFNNILAAAALHAQYLEGRTGDESALRPHVLGVSASIRRAIEQVERLLLFSGSHPFEPRTVDLGAFLAGVAEGLPVSLDPQAPPAAGRLTAELDPIFLRYALTILVNKIVQWSGSENELRLSCDRPADPPQDPEDAQAGHRQWARIRICGQPGQWVRRLSAELFEPYRRSADAIDTDLDISAASGVINRHGGTLRIHEGERPELRILLPSGD